MCEHLSDKELKPLEYLDDILTKYILDTRTVLIHGEINEDSAYKTVKELLYLASVSKEPIKVILNSVGGKVYEGLFVYDTVRDLASQGIEITMEGRGVAASMGILLLQAGSKRIISKHTRIMIHEMSDVCVGKTSQIEDETKETKIVNDMLRDILAEKSKKTSAEIEAICKRRDIWMSAEEALEFGLVDEIV